jgi:hypothetical protein
MAESHKPETASILSIGTNISTQSGLSSGYDVLLAEENTILNFIPEALTQFVEALTNFGLTIIVNNDESEINNSDTIFTSMLKRTNSSVSYSDSDSKKKSKSETKSKLDNLIEYLTDLNKFIKMYNSLHENNNNNVGYIGELIKQGEQLQPKHTQMRHILTQLFALAENSEILRKIFIPNYVPPTAEEVASLRLTDEQTITLKHELRKNELDNKLGRILQKMGYIETLLPRLKMLLLAKQKIKQGNGNEPITRKEQGFYFLSVLNEKIKAIVDDVPKKNADGNQPAEYQGITDDQLVLIQQLCKNVTAQIKHIEKIGNSNNPNMDMQNMDMDNETLSPSNSQGFFVVEPENATATPAPEIAATQIETVTNEINQFILEKQSSVSESQVVDDADKAIKQITQDIQADVTALRKLSSNDKSGGYRKRSRSHKTQKRLRKNPRVKSMKPKKRQHRRKAKTVRKPNKKSATKKR